MRSSKQFYAFVFFFLVLLTSCTSGVNKLTKKPLSVSVLEASQQEENKILILQFSAFQTTSEKDSIMLASAKIVPGFLKTEITNAPTIPHGKIRCTFVDKNDAFLKSTAIDHPLNLSLEVPPIGEEDASHNNSNIKLKEGGFILRTRYSKDIKYVIVEKNDEREELDYRIKFELPTL